MSQKKKRLEFKKSVDWDSHSKTKPLKQKRDMENRKIKNEELLKQRNRAKFELIKKYNLSEKEAEEILRNIERKPRQKKENINANEEIRISKIHKVEEEENVIIPQHVISREYKKRTENNKEKITKPQKKIIKEPIHTLNPEKENFSDTKNFISQDQIDNRSNKRIKDVDSIISDIVPDYKKNLSVKVEDVSLSFDIEKDKIDNLKEYVIRTIKHNKEKKTKFQALKDISFEIYSGEKIGIIGYNGAGKSTLLNVITGIYTPEKGTVKTYGKISPLLSLGAGFDYNYSGRENIFLNGAVLGYDKKFLKEKYDEIVEFSELEEFINYPIKNYSSGMIAKLGFSIATIVEPDILIIDEVLGVGDVNFQKKSSDKIKSLMDGKTTVLLVSHSIGQIRELCDKAMWIYNGELREFGEVNEVCDHYLKDAEKASKEQLRNIRLR